jgi:hypothetical protein
MDIPLNKAAWGIFISSTVDERLQLGQDVSRWMDPLEIWNSSLAHRELEIWFFFVRIASFPSQQAAGLSGAWMCSYWTTTW